MQINTTEVFRKISSIVALRLAVRFGVASQAERYDFGVSVTETTTIYQEDRKVSGLI